MATAVGMLALLAGPAAASADTTDDLASGLWYYEETGIPEAQQHGTGEGVTIALLDSGVDPDAPMLQGADLVGTEFDCGDGTQVRGFGSGIAVRHGTTLATILAGNGQPLNDSQPGIPGIAPDVTIVAYDILPDDETTPELEPYTCERSIGHEQIMDAVDRGVDLIVSAIGGNRSALETQALLTAMRAGIPVIQSAPNSAAEAQFGGAFEINGVAAIENSGSTGERDDPVVGPAIAVVAPGDRFLRYIGEGSDWQPDIVRYSNSVAVPYVGGVLALLKSAYPDATGDQLLQALVRSTDGGNPDLARTDEEGYGFIGTRTMFETDPTSYPDENPLIRADGWPRPVDFEDGVYTDDAGSDWPLPGQDTADGEASPAGEEPEAAPFLPGIMPLLIGVAVVVAVLVIAGVIVLIVVRARRRPRA